MSAESKRVHMHIIQYTYIHYICIYYRYADTSVARDNLQGTGIRFDSTKSSDGGM